MVRIKSSWTPRVRYAARRYRRTVRRAQRNFAKSVTKGTSEGEAMSVMCAEEAKAVLELLNILGYGGGRRMAPARDRLELELQVHERDEGPSINFFRLFLAQKRDTPLERVFSRKGRERTKVEAEAMRWQHIDELRTALSARKAAHAWLSQYFGRFELGKKYREFARMQFDESLDDGAKAAYMSLLFTQIAQRSGRKPEDVLLEYNQMVQALDLRVPSAEIELEEEREEEEECGGEGEKGQKGKGGG